MTTSEKKHRDDQNKTGDLQENRYEIRLSGFGGQGLIFAGVVLAEAAGIHEQKYVAQTQSYGPEARGGKSRAEVVISNTPIDFPKPMSLDLLLAMSQDACDTYFIDLKPSGILITDSTQVKDNPLNHAYSFPLSEISIKKTGSAQAANMVALGVVCMVSGVATIASVRKALKSKSPAGSADKNLKALNAGYQLAKSFLESEED